MRVTTSNPVEAALDSFSKGLNVMNALDMRTRQKEMWNREDEQYFGQKNLNLGASGFKKMSDANGDYEKANLTDQEEWPLLSAAVKKQLITNDGKVDTEKLHALNTVNHVIQNDPNLKKMQESKGKGVIDLDKNPDLKKALHDLHGEDIDQGVDKYGNKASKEANKVYIDFSSNPEGTVAFGLHVTPPKEGAANMVPLPGFESNVFTIPEMEGKMAAGQTERGNIDLSKRKVAINKDGSISTVLSMSIEADGKEVLIPQVSPEGKVLSKEEAIAQYRKTGQHLGKFDDAHSADLYAEKLHSSKIWQPSLDYYVKGKDGYDSPMTWGANGDPKAPIQQIPVPLFSAHLSNLKTLGDTISQMQAKYGETEFSKKVMDAESKRKERATIAEALEGIDEKLPVSEKRQQVIKKLTEKNIPVKEAIEIAKMMIADKPAKQSDVGLLLDEKARAEAEGNTEEAATLQKAIDAKTSSEKGESIDKDLLSDDLKKVSKAKKALKIKEEIRASSDAAKEDRKKRTDDEKEGDKKLDGRLKAIKEDAYADDIVKKKAMDNIRKDKKLDSFAAIDKAKKEIEATIAGETSGEAAAAKLVKAGLATEEEAKAYIKKRIERQKKKDEKEKAK